VRAVLILLAAIFLFLPLSLSGEATPGERADINVLDAPMPEYPFVARRDRIQGNGLYLIHFNLETGLPLETSLVRSTGYQVLDEAALDALGHWRVRPHTLAKIRVPVTFRLEGVRASVPAPAGRNILTAPGFPSEKEMKARLRKGMSMQEVLAAFGEPNNQLGPPDSECRFRYVAPFAYLTAEREGYIGFEVQFDRGQVVGWRSFRGFPSYEPLHVPREAKWFGKFYLILCAVLVFLGLAGRRLIRMSQDTSLVESFNRHEIATGAVPSEFRFLTHGTTLAEATERLGEPTRVRKMSVDAGKVRSAGFIEGDDGRPAILVVEYELPSGDAIDLVPEYPFESGSRIRTVHYRKQLPDPQPQA
jgi:TonB family protein